jgi:hypothetical protein
MFICYGMFMRLSATAFAAQSSDGRACHQTRLARESPDVYQEVELGANGPAQVLLSPVSIR